MSRTLPRQHLAPNFGSCSPGATLLPLHPRPPCAACTRTPRVRTCVPPPQLLEHLEILTEGMTTSMTRNDGGRLKKLDAGYPESPRQRYFDAFISQSMDTFYIRQLLHQAPFSTFTLDTFYTRHLLHQTPVTPSNFYNKQLLHQAPFTPETFYTRHLLHQTPLTPNTLYNNFYNKQLLHQAPFTPGTFCTKQLLH